MNKLFPLIVLLSILSCSRSTKDYIDGGDFKFWYTTYFHDHTVLDVWYFDNSWKHKYFFKYRNGTFEYPEWTDEIPDETWNLVEDSLIVLNGFKRLIKKVNDSILIIELGYEFDWSRIDTLRAAPRSMIPDEFYHRY